MHEEEWVIWNGAYGIVKTATLGRIEAGEGGRIAWMDLPYDMLDPFSLDELEACGRIEFAACIVMSRRRWHMDQEVLRRESLEKRRESQERMNEEFANFFGERHRARRKSFDERAHREALNLPIEGKLDSSQIKAAFRRLAQKVHPDMGGTDEAFVRITEARNALLEFAS
jgi:hypothetical protein